MNALVTGANGFLGKYIVEQLLADGEEVRTFTRRSDEDLERLGVDMHLGDIRDADKVSAACQQIDVVFHAAGVAGIWGPREHFFGINLTGTENIIAGCQQHDVHRLVYTSSPSVVFDGTDHRGVDESVSYPTQWLGHYSHSKALAEQAVLRANDNEILLTCSLRPHLIWGPRDNHLIPRLLDRARSGKLRIVGDGSNLVDNVYVGNAAEAHLLAAAALDATPDSRGRAYFVSQGEPVNCWNWINEILSLANVQPVTRAVPFRVAYCAGAAAELAYTIMRRNSEPAMTRFLAGQLAKSHYFDISQARKLLGYEPNVSKETGMQRLKEWMLRSDL